MTKRNYTDRSHQVWQLIRALTHTEKKAVTTVLRSRRESKLYYSIYRYLAAQEVYDRAAFRAFYATLTQDDNPARTLAAVEDVIYNILPGIHAEPQGAITHMLQQARIARAKGNPRRALATVQRAIAEATAREAFGLIEAAHILAAEIIIATAAPEQTEKMLAQNKKQQSLALMQRQEYLALSHLEAEYLHHYRHTLRTTGIAVSPFPPGALDTMVTARALTHRARLRQLKILSLWNFLKGNHKASAASTQETIALFHTHAFLREDYPEDYIIGLRQASLLQYHNGNIAEGHALRRKFASIRCHTPEQEAAVAGNELYARLAYCLASEDQKEFEKALVVFKEKGKAIMANLEAAASGAILYQIVVLCWKFQKTDAGYRYVLMLIDFEEPSLVNYNLIGRLFQVMFVEKQQQYRLFGGIGKAGIRYLEQHKLDIPPAKMIFNACRSFDRYSTLEEAEQIWKKLSNRFHKEAKAEEWKFFTDQSIMRQWLKDLTGFEVP